VTVYKFSLYGNMEKSSTSTKVKESKLFLIILLYKNEIVNSKKKFLFFLQEQKQHK